MFRPSGGLTLPLDVSVGLSGMCVFDRPKDAETGTKQVVKATE